MNEIKKLQSEQKFSHVSIGNPELLSDKLFLKDSLNLTSCEISFGSLNPQQEVPFFHSHKQNEEIYIILKGYGNFQVNDEVFKIEAGSIIRVSTNCDRSLKCLSEEPMNYLCIQAKEDSLTQCTMEDGVITKRDSKL